MDDGGAGAGISPPPPPSKPTVSDVDARSAVIPYRRTRYRRSTMVGARPRKMKRTTKTIIDLPGDMVQHILFLLALSDDGAADTARAICSCKMFKEIAMGKENLKVLVFNESSAYVKQPSFWQNESLVNKSAHLGNISARKIVLECVKNLVACAKYNLRSVEAENTVVAVLNSNHRRTRSITTKIRASIVRLEAFLSDANLAVMKAEELVHGL